MGKTNMIFIDPGTKVNSLYHFLLVLGKRLLPDIQARWCQHKMDISTGWCASVHSTNTTDYLKKEKIDFIEPDV